MMQQLSLFNQEAEAPSRRPRLDDESEQLIQQYGEQRARQGASRQSVLREVSQLRSIARECGFPGPPFRLAEAFTDVALIAHVLRAPSIPISRSTGRARLLAVQRFFQMLGPKLGRDAAADLITLDALLPSRGTDTWHTAGTLVAGEPGRRRNRGPTLDAVDLFRIVEAAGAGSEDLRTTRDRALVAIQCFSGLRIEEIHRLQWEDLHTGHADGSFSGYTVMVERAGRLLQLPLLGPISETLDTLKEAVTKAGLPLSAPVFRASGSSCRPLSYRGGRKVLVHACRRAGLPPATSAELRAGCAHWLRSQGLSDHEVAIVLGLARVRTVDRLLSRHAALDAQRRVREQLG